MIMAWAIKHGVSAIAMDELRQLLMGELITAGVAESGTSESAVSSIIRLEAAERGVLLLRNNVGVLANDGGRPVRYGLANDSAAMNKQLKSADFIGIRPVRIQPEHIGQVIGQFVSREAKRVGWRYTGAGREEAQMRWVNLVTSYGGNACFASGAGTF